MYMETIKKYNVDQMKEMASRYIHGIFKGAIMVNAIYKNTFVQASCLWPDGVREYLMVFYRDIEKDAVMNNQYDRARRIVGYTFGKEAAL